MGGSNRLRVAQVVRPDDGEIIRHASSDRLGCLKALDRQRIMDRDQSGRRFGQCQKRAGHAGPGPDFNAGRHHKTVIHRQVCRCQGSTIRCDSLTWASPSAAWPTYAMRRWPSLIKWRTASAVAWAMSAVTKETPELAIRRLRTTNGNYSLRKSTTDSASRSLPIKSNPSTSPVRQMLLSRSIGSPVRGYNRML